MLIVADENIPFIDACLGDGLEAGLDVKLMPGRAIDREALEGARALLVRSVTSVDADMIEGSSVEFVGSATAGIDHIDVTALGRLGVRFAHAPGCNSESVAQYVTAALFALRERLGGLAGRAIGIVGVGHCGSKVERVARGLGMEVFLCDPPLARASGESDRYVSLDKLARCDVVTLHVPLTREGADATLGMIGEEFLGHMHSEAFLINAARGGLVDESALRSLIAEKRLGGAVLDTWIGEPEPSSGSIEIATIATPHIAGYSIDAKLRGTSAVCDALACHFSVEPARVDVESLLGAGRTITLSPVAEPEATIGKLITEAYALAEDDRDFRRVMGAAQPAERASEFDRLRKTYGPRREFSATRLIVDKKDRDLAKIACAVGFAVGFDGDARD